MKKKIDWGYLGSLALAVVLALLVGALIMLITGHDPMAAYSELVKGATGCNKWSDLLHIFSKRQFGNTIEYAMVLFLTGLACAIGARVGIFNVGGEGQLYLGAIVSAYIGAVLAGRTPWIVIPMAALGGMIAGGFYAWIPGVLKVKLKVNEVITTIMMNSIAIYLCAYLSSGPWKTTQPGPCLRPLSSQPAAAQAESARSGGCGRVSARPRCRAGPRSPKNHGVPRPTRPVLVAQACGAPSPTP